MPYFPSLPDDATTAQIFAADPDLFAPYLEFSQSVMRGPSPLSTAQREILGAFVSGLNACGYCAGGHEAAAVEFGVDAGLFAELMEDVDGAAVDDKFKPILRFIRKLTLDPNRITQADADAVFDAGWPEQALRDAVLICGLFSLMNRVVKAHGIVPDPSKFAERGRRAASLGYAGQRDQT